MEWYWIVLIIIYTVVATLTAIAYLMDTGPDTISDSTFRVVLLPLIKAIFVGICWPMVLLTVLIS